MVLLATVQKKLATYIKLLTISVILYILSGCALFQSPCGADCEARHVCNDLNTKFINDNKAFIYAIRASNLELVQSSCRWREGLVLPKGKEHWEKLIDPDIKTVSTADPQPSNKSNK